MCHRSLAGLNLACIFKVYHWFRLTKRVHYISLSFDAMFIFWARWDIKKNWLEPKAFSNCNGHLNIPYILGLTRRVLTFFLKNLVREIYLKYRNIRISSYKEYKKRSRCKVGGVGGCAEFYFFHEISFIYNYLG
jgi:hypothetical protein